MPELAETFILASQLAQLFGVPLESDSRLVLPKRLEVSKFSSGPYHLVVHDHVSIRGDESIEESLAEATPTRVQHQGKKMWILWKNEKEVVETEVRLGMTGSFRVEKTPHSRLEFKCAAGSIFFNDIRKFGGFALGANSVAPSASAKVNIEQLYFATQEFKATTLKEILTDQNFIVSGVGNYLVNEVCFKAKLSPYSQVGAISLEEFGNVLRLLRETVLKSVECGGCTLRDFKDVLARPGSFQDHLEIYGKKTCPSCSKPIKAVRRQNETTSWVCVPCQMLKRCLPA